VAAPCLKKEGASYFLLVDQLRTDCSIVADIIIIQFRSEFHTRTVRGVTHLSLFEKLLLDLTFMQALTIICFSS
jgi:hypothetical protein